jgi:glycosyltransferase involved in cell wall biosynthesis
MSVCKDNRVVVLISGNHLCHNPRVLKEADVLHTAGFSVTVLGAWIDHGLAERDRELLAAREWIFVPILNLAATTSTARWKRIWLRARTRLGHILGRWFHCENRWQLGYCAPELLQAARHQSADLFIAHSEPALWVADQLRRNGACIGVDMEDWFSEDLLPEARKYRPIQLLHDLERSLLKNGAHATCPSQAMSEILARTFECSPPTVIYNAFRWTDRETLDGCMKDRKDQRIPSIHWYSQTIGRGRGLEDLLAALPYLKHEVEIHLRGNPVAGFKEWFMAQLPEKWRTRVFFHDIVPNDELLSRISEHDIGFSGETKFCRSRDLTVTNKILQYLLAGLAVVASDTEGHREVSEQSPGAVHLYISGCAEDLAAQLNHLLSAPEILSASKAAALRAAKETFCWERIAPHLVVNVQHAVAAR